MSDPNVRVFFVDVRPVPKARPRLGKHGNVYTPTSTVQFENHVAAAARTVRMPELGHDVDITVNIQLMLRHRDGDIDNYVKAVLDGMRAFFNDRQVVELHALFIRTESHEVEGVHVEVVWKSVPKIEPVSDTTARTVARRKTSSRSRVE